MKKLIIVIALFITSGCAGVQTSKKKCLKQKIAKEEAYHILVPWQRQMLYGEKYFFLDEHGFAILTDLVATQMRYTECMEIGGNFG
jgi:uncharacterized protein YceK|tara:strand:- start:4115 stop:4372 length:258 start_codon:yes stop_codon:yes gene_type:complete